MSNSTLFTPAIEVTAHIELISDETTTTVVKLCRFVIVPVISILGITGNSLSISILLKHGLHKSSNILLFVLAVADVTYLIAYNSIPKLVFVYHGRGTFRFSESSSRVWFAFFVIFNFLDFAMSYVSMSLPMLITMERLVAVFLPLRFPRIITPFRTWAVVALVYVFWCAYFIYVAFHGRFDFGFDPRFNISVGRRRRSAFYYQLLESGMLHYISNVSAILNSVVPPVFTLVGCVIIYVKIKITLLKRKKMTSSAASISTLQTTKMLLAVCAIYLVAGTFVSLPILIPQVEAYFVTNRMLNNLGQVIAQAMNVVFSINSSCNFIVYVGMNKNFRDTLKSMFTHRRTASHDGREKEKRAMRKLTPP